MNKANLAVERKKEVVDHYQGGLNLSRMLGTVSYTHLTLPTILRV